VTHGRQASGRPVRAVFLGSGPFAVPVGEVLAHRPAAQLVAVVTAPPRPQGRDRQLRSTPVGNWAADRGLPVMTPARLRDADTVGQLVEMRPDIIVLADYGRLVPPQVLSLPAHGALNLHPSLLPRHRGASPIQAAIAAGDEETGVSLMLMDAGLDTGPLLAQRRMTLAGRETAPELERLLAQAAAQLLADNLIPWLDGALEPVPQPAEGATLTRPLAREDGRLDPTRPAVALERQVRAYQPWPGSFLEAEAGRLTVWQSAALPASAAVAGEVGDLIALPAERVGGPALALVTADGILELTSVQPAGGRRMSGMDLLRGRPSLAGTRVRPTPAAPSGQER
jgi:methionyl-tRNA formyltransferase